MARRRLASPVLPFPDPAPPLDNDDLLREILLLLPPQPSSLLRASVVCKRWHRLVSDPGFLRRFRAHHRKPPLLGLFSVDTDGFCPFIPTLDPLDRIPAARFSLPRCCRHQSSHFVECRHGLALFLDRIYPEAVVWNPISGHQRRVTFPPEFGNARDRDILCSAVLCAAGEDDNGHVHGDCDLNSFKLALLRRGEQDRTIVLACLYESKSGEWGNVISTSTTTTTLFVWRKPSVLVGDALCWLLGGGGIKGDILELDFEMQKLVVIDKPGDSSLADCVRSCLQIIQTEESNLGLIIHTGPSLRLWEHKVNYDDVATWILHKTIDLIEHLSIVELKWSLILLYDEDHNVIFLWAPYADSSFMIQLDSIQFGNCYRTNFEATISQKSKFCYTTCVPYTSFYTADWATGGRVDGPEMLSSTRPDCPNR